MVATAQPHNSASMRYQIADGIIDLIQVFWVGFYLAAAGTFTMGGVSVFAPLTERFPHPLQAVYIGSLILIPAVAIRRGRISAYMAARIGSALFFTLLSWLCLAARPISTGVIYSAIALGAAALALSALLHSLRWTV